MLSGEAQKRKQKHRESTRVPCCCCCCLGLSSFWSCLKRLHCGRRGKHDQESSPLAPETREYPIAIPLSKSPSPAMAATMPSNGSSDISEPEISKLTMVNKPFIPEMPQYNGHNGDDYAQSVATAHTTGSTIRHGKNYGSATSGHDITFSSDQQVTVLRETVTATRFRFVSDIDFVTELYIDSMSIASLMEYIERQRLTHMPHRGSRWDKVLKWAEFFAVQISGYEKAVSSFVPGSKGAAKLVWTSCKMLLELGPENSQALETTFAVFYKLGLSISFFLRHHKLLSINSHIRMEVGQAFNDMLILVREVSLYYRAQTSTLFYNQITIDFNGLFGRHIDAFNRRKSHIVDAMWEYTMEGGVAMDVRVVRNWLSTRDEIVKLVHKDRVAARGRRDEFTCDWFQRQLLDFSRSKDDVLAITGAPGSGKTILSGWIVERLQRSLGRKSYETLSYTIDGEIPGECTSVAVAKGLALQLLQVDIGDAKLLKALTAAYKTFCSTKEEKDVERDLWTAIDHGLDNVTNDNNNLMIVVDGLDEIRGGADAINLISNRLGALADKHRGVQTITLSRSLSKYSKAKVLKFELTADRVHHDIRHLATHALEKYAHFKDQNEFAREKLVDQLADAAKGNFFWIGLTTDFLKQETTHEGFMKAVKHVTEKPNSLDETVHLLLSKIDFSKFDTKLIVSWLLAAQRPLTVFEIKELLQVDLPGKKLLTRKGDAHEIVLHACGPLVTIQNGIVHFRHSTIREHVLHLQKEKERKILNDLEAQTDLTGRLLLYCKLTLTEIFEPALRYTDIVKVDDMFQQHALLEYAAKNWILHFHKSSYNKRNSSYEFSPEFKAIFPTSVQLTMLEWACWEHMSVDFSYKIVTYHETAYRIRKGVFTEKHETVIQSLIICGSFYQKLSNITEAATCFYRASIIGQAILKKFSAVVTSCTTMYLTITESIRSSTRTEIITRKEEMLKYIIIAFKHQHGETSDIVIRYYRTLAELYVEIKEEEHAETTWRELREIIIIRHGKGSEEETSISGRLDIILKKGKREEVIEYEKGIFEETMELEVWDIRRIKITLELAVSYEARGEIFLAEELYIKLWALLIQHCHQSGHRFLGVEIHISMIDVALEYIRFLIRHHRHEEACSILICIWSEYEEYDFESEVIFFKFKIMGEIMRAVSLLTLAVSVFRKCFAWFKFHGKYEYSSSCEVLISETVEEITTVTTTTTTTTTTSTTTEIVIKEAFESTLSKTTITSETITVCKSLISYYMKLEMWSEAIECTRRTLTLLWKLVVCGGTVMALPREFAAEAIEIAISLAICHHRMHHYHEAEEIYIRIYRSCWNSCNVHDAHFLTSYTILVNFYREHRRWHKMIEIYCDILVGYRKHLGASHKLTIEVLYILGDMCVEHGFGALEYYEEIVMVLNGDSAICHHDARRAMIVLCRIYYEEGHWHKLHGVCEVLWDIYLHHHHEFQFEVEFVEMLFMRYQYVLEYHFHCEFEVLRRICFEYRETCIKIFGASAAITIRALIELANISMRKEKYYHEAISYYEEVIQTTTTTTTTTVVSTSTMTTIKEKLTKAYVHQCTHGSVTTSTLERAIVVLLERFGSIKASFGCSHSETLIVLRELIFMYRRLKTEESMVIIKRMLVESFVEIISVEKHSKALFAAAKLIGALFVSCELVGYAQEILIDIRRQIITRKFSSKHGFVCGKGAGRSSFAFLVTFEACIRLQSVSYAEILAEILTESVLYESYTRSIEMKASMEIILTKAACLRAFYFKRSRKEEISTLEIDVFEMFLKKWGSSVKTRREVTFKFYLCILEELGKEALSIRFGRVACIASIAKVRYLLEQGSYQDAYDVALCAFHFINHQHEFQQLENIPYGFKLSALMAGRKLQAKSKKPLKEELHQQMLQLSRTIISEVLRACQEAKINFVRLKLRELNDLVGLLGEQENYGQLEILLDSLWSSREVQKNWSPETIIAIGARLVQARFLGGHREQAQRLCEDICYNLRRVWGALDSKALEMSDLLSQVYTQAGHFREAMRVHEEILRLVVDGDDDDDSTLDTMTAPDARKQLELLRRCHARLGGWDKSARVYEELTAELLRMPQYAKHELFRGVQGAAAWSAKDKPADEKLGTFATPEEWEFTDSDLISDHGDGLPASSSSSPTAAPRAGGKIAGPKRPGIGMKRASSNWGMALVQRYLHGEEDLEEEQEGRQADEVEQFEGNGINGFGKLTKATLVL